MSLPTAADRAEPEPSRFCVAYDRNDRLKVVARCKVGNTAKARAIEGRMNETVVTEGGSFAWSPPVTGHNDIVAFCDGLPSAKQGAVILADA